MMSKDANKLDELKAYGAEGMTFENDFQECRVRGTFSLSPVLTIGSPG